MYTFCRSELMYTKCIQNVSCISTNICFQMYAKCNVYKMFTNICQIVVYILHTFCIHQLYTSIHLYTIYFEIATYAVLHERKQQNCFLRGAPETSRINNF